MRFSWELYACTNPTCLRKVKASVRYCCISCSAAHEGAHEVHRHTPDCDNRREDRGEWGLEDAAIRRLL